MKEALREFYRLRKREEAEERLRDLIAIAGLSDDAEIVRWSRTLERWSEYILNYFHNRTTNAYTEGIHTKKLKFILNTKIYSPEEVKPTCFSPYIPSKHWSNSQIQN